MAFIVYHFAEFSTFGGSYVTVVEVRYVLSNRIGALVKSLKSANWLR